MTLKRPNCPQFASRERPDTGVRKATLPKKEGSINLVLSATETDKASAGDREKGAHLDTQREQIQDLAVDPDGRGTRRGGGRFLMLSRN